MKLISEKLEKELEYQEFHPFSIPSARKALEAALTEQFRNLADAILASLLFKNVSISELTWWHYFLTRTDEINSYRPDYNNQSFTNFRKEIAHNIATGKIKALSFSDLGKVEIRIFGGFVKLWDDIKINKQLVRLGSSYRLTFLGSHALAVNRIIELLKPELDIDKNDPRFIWGEVDDLTSTPFGLRFSYTREYAFSPLMDEAGEGFNFDTTIAIRENLIRARVEQSYSKTAIETEDYSNMFFTSKLHVTGHELSHLFSFHSKLIRPYRETFWKDDSKYDICRFFQIARKYDEIQENFIYTCLNFFVSEINKYFEQDKQINLNQFFESLLKEMQGESLIEKTSEGKLYSPIYEDGKIWVV